MEEQNPTGLTSGQGRRFGLSVGVAFWGLGGVLIWKDHLAEAYGAFAVGGVLVLSGLLIPRRLGPLERAWMGLARAISRVTTPVLMALVYFLLLSPLGVLMRMVGKNPLARNTGGESFWVKRSQTGSDLKRQF